MIIIVKYLLNCYGWNMLCLMTASHRLEYLTVMSIAGWLKSESWRTRCYSALIGNKYRDECDMTLRDSHVTSALSRSWLARLKCAYSRVKTVSGKIQIRTSDSQLWHNELVLNFTAASNVYLFIHFNFHAEYSKSFKVDTASTIHRWKHPDIASFSLAVVFGTLWTGSDDCDNIIGECHHSRCHWHWLVAGADHLPIYGTGPIWCVPGCVYNGQCDRDHRWPLEARGNFPITCHGPSQNSATETKTLANTQSWPPPPLHAGPITGHWSLTTRQFLSPDLHVITSICVSFCCDQQSLMWYCHELCFVNQGYQLARSVLGVWAVQSSAGIWVKVGSWAWDWGAAGSAGQQSRCQYRHYTCRCHVSRVTCPMGGAHVLTISQYNPGVKMRQRLRV